MNKVLIQCTIASALGGLLFGYDTVIINGAMLDLVKHFNLTPAIQGWTVSSALVGCILGTILMGKPGDIFGAQRLLQLLAVLFLISAVGCGLAPTISVFILFRFIGGLAIGGASVICPVYISEISPPKHRGLLASTFQLAIVFGILLSLISNYLLLNIGENNWRWMLFSGALPAVAFFVMLFFIRKSPRWLVKKGRIEEARKNIEDLSSHEIDTEQTLSEIRESINIEDAGKKINLFKKPYRKIVWLGIFVGIFSQLTGIGVVFYYSAQIFSIAGFSPDTSMLQSVILGLTNLVFTLIAMLLIDRVGRKKLLIIGQLGMVAVLGLFGYGLLSGNITGYWLVVLLVAYIAFFAASMGVVIWVMLSEMFPNIIRARGASLGSFANWGVSASLNFLFPQVVGLFGTTLAQQQMGMSYAFLFLAGMTLLGFFFLKNKIIETKGKSLEQIEKEVLC
ncbi:MAG: sugar porter family MFS transporter [Bacteroidales bacterium]|nr:sugar porter family MFS transporter [Bacteroidales bacterium]MBK8882101.1 sugar porter family MFS transporter [Bacteroidales bacterium]